MTARPGRFAGAVIFSFTEEMAFVVAPMEKLLIISARIMPTAVRIGTVD